MKYPPKSKRIPGFPLYRADIFGSVWRLVDGEWIQPLPFKGKYGHLHLNLKGSEGWKPMVVHQVILFAFVGPKPKGMVCRHFPDRNPQNNKLENLSWSTPVINQHDKYIHGTHNKGERCGTAVLTWSIVRRIRKMNKQGIGYRRLSKRFGVACRTIYDVIKWKTWKE